MSLTEMKGEKMEKHKLTEGDLRFIDEALHGWRMRIDMSLGGEEASEEVKARISEYEENYKKEFTEYFDKVRQEDEDKSSDDIQYDFDEEWEKKYPGFFEMDRLLK